MTELDVAGIFEPDGDRWVPTPIATGPWSPDALHGGPATALVGRLIVEHDPGDTDWFLSRLTVELIRPVPHAPLSVAVELRRPGTRAPGPGAGRRAPHGTEGLWARGLRLARADNGLGEGAGRPVELRPLPGPAASEAFGFEDLVIPWTTFGEAY